MKKTIFVSLIFMGSLFINAQSNIGFLTDNYSGVNSVIANPANITDSRFKTDINLFGVSAFAGNDYYGVNILDAVKADYDFDLDANKTPSNNNNIAFNVDVMGPAFMFNLNSKSSVAIFTRARAMVNINEINGNTIDGFDDDTTDDFNVNEGDFNMFGQAWSEVGFTYARELLNNETHYLKGGVTLKLLQGQGTGYLNGKNVTINYDADGTDPNTGSISSTGQLTYGRFAEFDNDNYDFTSPDASGFGADLGFVYEWRPKYAEYTSTNEDGETVIKKNKNKYKLKLGVSVTDIGSINYKNGSQDVYDITNTNVSEDDFENADDFDEFLSTFYSLESSTTGFKVSLPTAFHLNADWSFTNNLYLNLNADFSLVAKDATNASRISNVFSATPRFETKWFSFYMPLSIVEHNGFQAGAGLRAGPLYIGSGSVLSVLSGDDIKGADVYMGLKIPIYQKNKK